MNEKIYIAGKITGLPYEEVLEKFNRMEAELKKRGFEVVNPCKLVPADTDWQEAMKACIKALVDCQYICLLPDWMDSRWATLERNLAQKLGLLTVWPN